MSSLRTTDIRNAIQFAAEKNSRDPNMSVQLQLKNYQEQQNKNQKELCDRYTQLFNKYFNPQSTDTLPLRILDGFIQARGAKYAVVKIDRRDFAGFHKLVGWSNAHPVQILYHWLQYIQANGHIARTLRFQTRESKDNKRYLYIHFVYTGN